jgi:hypothetical protein
MRHRIIRSRHRFAGARINVVVMLLILAILAALGLPAVQQAREAARRSTCKGRLKRIGLSLMNYHDVHRTLPRGVVVSQVPTPSGGNHLGWVYQILLYLDSSPLFEHFDSNLDITSIGARSNSVMAAENVYLIRCPSDSSWCSVSGRRLHFLGGIWQRSE